jgi:hypothetical protein
LRHARQIVDFGEPSCQCSNFRLSIHDHEELGAKMALTG